MIDPAAWVYVRGQYVSADLAGDNPTALECSVTWGRSEVLAQPDVATGQVTIFDPLGTWGTGLESLGQPDLLGEVCDLGYTQAGARHAFFRGRVTTAAAQPFTLAGRRGALLVLQVTSRLAELANFTNTAWPNEATPARAPRLLSEAGSRTAGAITAIPTSGLSNTGLRARAAGDRDLLTALLDMYVSGNQTMSYLPDTTSVVPIPRRAYVKPAGDTSAGRRGLAGLRRSAERTGAYIAALAFGPALAQEVQPQSTAPLYLGDLPAPSGGWLTRGAASAVTRVEVTWWSVPTGAAAGVYNQATAPYTVPRTRTGLAEQVATVATEIYDSAAAGSAQANAYAASLASAALNEAGGWQLAPIELDLARTGGLENTDQLTALFAGGEQQVLLFLQGTELPWLGVRPVFALIGGTIGRVDGRWLLTLNLAPVYTPIKQHAITWEEIDDGTAGNTLNVYLDGADHADGLHPSVTVDDLGYCSTGLGVTTPGPDQGWDTLQ